MTTRNQAPPHAPAPHPLAGIGDEAAPSLEGQLAAVQTLGWQALELRSLDGVPLADVPAADIRAAARRLAGAGVRVVALASRIGNWSRPVTGDLAQDLDELRVMEEYAALLDCRRVRVMSYPNAGLPQDEWGRRAVERLGLLTGRAEAAGLTLLHENCAGWAGSDAGRTLRLLSEVDSPALRVLFDTGNGVPHGYRAADLLGPLLPYVAHVHIKDAVRSPDGTTAYVLPGDGEAEVEHCLRTLLAAGYTGPLSLEPHLALRPHEGLLRPGEGAGELFVRAGRRLEGLLAGLTDDTGPGHARGNAPVPRRIP
ncbi:sugar phosphate isomerase/epimerase [Streptomyces sp. NBC_01754]|uniref:sugar phosphate isomerase/epimerase family protein n=1 Tax=Streptomyces sp. NBC_01754 TaxID=2975930 RepID=UPI002DDB260D|nr:sugar phosphate isomerase/epimerase family protein [Streptomyces sp. NBC_01754]WSC94908.1 sugar phosphate isomerase/epimerase [Streptomyces sp. NBC_01754]